MKVLMLSWEFPPKIVGGIARHVYDLALALVKQDIDVSVITCGVQDAADYETIHGVKVYRVVMNNPSTPDFLTWVLQLNLNMTEMANRLALLGATFDIIHAHDWLAAFAGKNLKHSWRIPLVSTIHATEYGRNSGLYNELQRYISNVEWWLGYESWRVICCSNYMKSELQRVFQMPEDKIRIIPNGVYPGEFEKTTLDPAEVRSHYCAPNEKLIFYVGRIVREKGLGVLLDAYSRVLGVEPNTKLVIAGKGPYLDELKHRAYQLGIYHRVYFAGYIDDDTRNALYKAATVAVFPSLYEPFGIVALEGMAAGSAVIASDAGGLGEIIQHGENGLKVYCDNVNSLADNIIWALQHPDHCGKMKAKALKDVQQIYSWDKIAAQTNQVYQEILEENQNSNWHAVMHEEAAREIIMSNMIKTIEAEEMTRYRDVH
jgi:glycogen(starch) synthase